MVDAGSSPWILAFFLLQMMLCEIVSTIVTSAVAERTRFAGEIILSLIVSIFIYPVLGHWIWNGTETGLPSGWLAKLGFFDFAGATVVHSTGGWFALAAAIIIGPRIGRFSGKVPIQGNNLPMSVLGVFLLWFGWFGFNGSRTPGVSEDIPLILVNTALSAVSGAGSIQ